MGGSNGFQIAGNPGGTPDVILGIPLSFGGGCSDLLEVSTEPLTISNIFMKTAISCSALAVLASIDCFFSCLGPPVKNFGKLNLVTYQQVKTDTNNMMKTDLLNLAICLF